MKGEPYSFETDVWSLGVLFYEILLRETPFESLSKKETYKLIKEDKTNYPEGFNDYIKEIIDMMLEKDRVKRISLKDLLNKLKLI